MVVYGTALVVRLFQVRLWTVIPAFFTKQASVVENKPPDDDIRKNHCAFVYVFYTDFL